MILLKYFLLCYTDIQVCLCVGETILSQHPETSSLSEYIPLYLQQATKNDHVCVAIMFNIYTNIML